MIDLRDSKKLILENFFHMNYPYRGGDHKAPCFYFLICLGFACLLEGCSQSNPDEPLTPELLVILSNGAFLQAHIEGVDPDNVIPLDEEIAKAILKSLIPIEKYEHIINFKTEYELLYQGGNTPMKIKIRISGEKLCYLIRNHVYEGGDVNAFRKQIDKLHRVFKIPKEETGQKE